METTLNRKGTDWTKESEEGYIGDQDKGTRDLGKE